VLEWCWRLCACSSFLLQIRPDKDKDKGKINKRSKDEDNRDEGQHNNKDRQNPYLRGSLTRG
jgi:hypothetical protein